MIAFDPEAAGLLTILATQRATGDSIPTAIRDVCGIAMSFAQTTVAASVAALGEQIKDFPDVDPMTLQGREYVGVLTMRMDGQPGFTRVRVPLPQLAALEQLAAEYASLTRSLSELTRSPVQAVPTPDTTRSAAERPHDLHRHPHGRLSPIGTRGRGCPGRPRSAGRRQERGAAGPPW